MNKKARKNPKNFRSFGEVRIIFGKKNDGSDDLKVLAHAQRFRCDKKGNLVLNTSYKRKNKKLETYSIIPENKR
jgi:hypothetical protein